MQIADTRIPIPPERYWSTVTNVVFLLLIPATQTVQMPLLLATLVSVASAALFMGSSLFHATDDGQHPWAQRLDEWGMMAVLTSLLGCAVYAIGWVPLVPAGLFTLAGWILWWAFLDASDSFVSIPLMGLTLFGIEVATAGLWPATTVITIGLAAYALRTIGPNDEHGVRHGLAWHPAGLVYLASHLYLLFPLATV